MTQNNKSIKPRTNKNRRGQVLIFTTLALPVLFGMVALVVDFGFIYYYQTQLNASTQAAALAGAGAMSQPGSTADSVTTAVNTYSGTSGNLNNAGDLPGVTMISGYPQFKCLSTLTSLYGLQCYGPSSSNALVVAQHVQVPLLFLPLFGGHQAVLSAVATAAMAGSLPGPYNVVILLDTTHSMNDTDSDSNCNNTRIYCAEQGVQVLLNGLAPCSPTESSCGAATDGNVDNSVDRVSLLTFPPVTTSTASDDYTCPTTDPTIVPYAFPFPSTSTYQVVNFSSDYRDSDTSTSLNTSSDVAIAVGAKTGCSGMQAPGGDGTYYAQAIYAAQSYLVSEQSSFPTAKNVLIILSDGDANATSAKMPGASTTSGTYPSTINQCHQAVTAAQSAASAGTLVYSVAYGAEASGCTTDSPAITPCQTMEDMASSPQYFFSDYTATGGSSSCISSAQPITGLNQIFAAIVTTLSRVKLIPNGTT